MKVNSLGWNSPNLTKTCFRLHPGSDGCILFQRGKFHPESPTRYSNWEGAKIVALLLLQGGGGGDIEYLELKVCSNFNG